MTLQATCDEVLPLLAPYADDSLAARERAPVAEHVLGCPSCRATLAAGRHARQLLRARADDLRSGAPAALRREVTEAARRNASPGAHRPRSRQRWAPLSAAAALLLAVVGAVTVGALVPSGTVLAAQLGLDHLKCLLLADRQAGVDSASLADKWLQERGWSIAVPPSSPADDLELVALRRCLYGDGEMAHLVYEHGRTSLSLFILPRSREAAPELEIMGLGTVAWSHGGRTYALVGDVPLSELSAVAAYMRPRVR